MQATLKTQKFAVFDQKAKNIFMALFIVFWPYLLITKLRCLQKNNFGHTKVELARYILCTCLLKGVAFESSEPVEQLLPVFASLGAHCKSFLCWWYISLWVSRAHLTAIFYITTNFAWENLVVWPPPPKLCQLTCLTAPEPLNKTFGIVLDGLRVTHWVIATKFDLKNHWYSRVKLGQVRLG